MATLVDPHRVDRARALLAAGATVENRPAGHVWLSVAGKVEMHTSAAVVAEARKPAELWEVARG